MRVTIAVNFPADERLGSAKIALREADELEQLGVSVRRVFRDDLPEPRNGRAADLSSPARVAKALWSAAADSDVVDIAGWDGFAYARLARKLRPQQAVVARSNGLWARALVADGKLERSALRALGSVVLQQGVYCRWEADSIRSATWARTLSSPDRDDIAARGWKPANRVSFVNPAADTVFDTDAPIAGRSGIAFMGSWISRKGTGVTIAALSRLLQARPELRFHVIGAGRSEAAVQSDFEASLRSRISVLPWGSPSELAAAVSRSAILLFPTRYEGFGLVVLEGMLAGAAVVTTRTGAGADAVRDGESGFVIGIDDADGAERALAQLLDDDGLRQRFAEAGRAEARSRSWRRSAEELLACYEAALRVARDRRAA